MLVDLIRDSPIGALVPINGYDPRFDEHYDHWAFVPHPLPSSVTLEAATWAQVSEAMLSLGRLDQAGRQIPNPTLLRRPTLRREAQSTSALEGTFAPLSDVLELDPDDGQRRSPELIEVLNYVTAAEHAYAAVGDRPVSMSLLHELHDLLMRDTASDGLERGQVRSHQVVIGAAGRPVTESRFVPPPGGPELESGLRDWVDWVNAARPAMPIVVSAALAHYQFETLHPFNDGNGRIGRLLIVVHLMLAGALHEPLLTVSPWFEARRTEYQDELLRVSQTGDWDRWVGFFASAIRAQADETTRKIDQLIAIHDRAKELCKTNAVKGVAVDIAESLIARPVLTAVSVQRHHGVSYPAANSAIGRLAQLGLLRETTGGSYGRVYANDDVIRILSR